MQRFEEGDNDSQETSSNMQPLEWQKKTTFFDPITSYFCTDNLFFTFFKDGSNQVQDRQTGGIWDKSKQVISKDAKILGIYSGSISSLLDSEIQAAPVYNSSNNKDPVTIFSTFNANITCHVLFENYSVYATTSGKLFIDDLKTKTVSKLTAHDKSIISLVALGKHKLLSTSLDDTFKIWDIKKQECKHSVKNYINKAMPYDLENKKILLAISGNKKSIQVYGKELNMACLYEEKDAYIQDFIIFANHLVLGLSDGTLKLFDLSKEELSLKLENMSIIKLSSKEGVQSLATAENNLVIHCAHKVTDDNSVYCTNNTFHFYS